MDASVSDEQILHTYVVADGAALLHRVHWQKTSAYNQTLHQLTLGAEVSCILRVCTYTSPNTSTLVDMHTILGIDVQ